VVSNLRRSRVRKRGPVLSKGLIVYDVSDPNDLGQITGVGPEVCEVAFTRSSKRFVSNGYLRISVTNKVAAGQAPAVSSGHGSRVAKPSKRPRD
jgi:hypothetical protein